MFLPAEAVFSYIYASCDEVVRYSYEEKVYMVSPTTLMAYLTDVYKRQTLHGWSALKHRISWKWMRQGWTGSIFIWRQAEAVHTAAPTVCPPPIELSACFPWSIS